MLRTHHCGELNHENAGEKVTLCGWVDRHRDMGPLQFVTIRDRYGVTQCVLDSKQSPLHQDLDKLNLEDCIQIQGIVRQREEKDQNSSQPTGAIEVNMTACKILNHSKELPFQVKDTTVVNDDLRLKYRYLDLRRPRMQTNLEIRHKVIQSCRQALCDMGFLEVETPLLVRSTPEGARDFVVPSRLHQGRFYALPQSPQLYKQMLMVSGCDRYFQFAPAFRDEDLRADRVPVHTQIDMEMSFVEEADVFAAVEHYLQAIFTDIKGINLPTPFPILDFHQAIDLYGTDKPDTRFELTIKTVTKLMQETSFSRFQEAACVRAIAVPEGSRHSRKKIEQWQKIAQQSGAQGLAWVKYCRGEASGGIAKFLNSTNIENLLSIMEASDDCLILFVADTYETASHSLGAVRSVIGKELELIDHGKFHFLWVNKFPLFEWNCQTQSYNAMHHLFTQPLEEDAHFLESDPSKVRGQLYDLVLNGVELLSGSIRINRPHIQKKILEIINMPREESESKFGFLMESFAYGAPPHGGSAMGLDRLVAILCGEESIREVIAFPCNNSGIFPLDGSPAAINEMQLKELGIKTSD